MATTMRMEDDIRPGSHVESAMSSEVDTGIGGSEAGVILLPARDGEKIELRLEDLATEPIEDLLQLLMEECIPLGYWLEIGNALMAVSEDDHKITTLLDAGVSEALNPTLGESTRRERMDVINLGATYYLSKFSKGSTQDEPDQKEQYLTLARRHYQQAEDQRLLVTSSGWVGRAGLEIATYLLHKRTENTYLEDAERYYEMAKDIEQNGHTKDLQQAHIGLGLVHYLKKDWKAAARNYQQVFRLGSASSNVLFSLALCHHKMKEFDKVQEIIIRILEHDPEHLGSLCAMAKGIVQPNQQIAESLGIRATEEDGTENNPRLQWLTKAVEAHPGNPLATVLLCDDLITTTAENSELSDILETALPKCTDRNVQAEIHYQMGRVAHKEMDALRVKALEENEDFTSERIKRLAIAEKHFRTCIDMYNGKHFSAMFSLAQVLGYRGQVEGALSLLEDIKETHPNDYAVMKLMAVLYSHRQEFEQGLDCVNVCIRIKRESGDEEHKEDDVGLWLLQARCLVALQNRGNVYVEAAVNAYKRILTYTEKEDADKSQLGDEIGFAVIHNNIGTLYFKDGQHDAAKESYTKALNIVEKVKGEEERKTALHASLIFNLACVYEELGDFAAASERYNSLTSKYPWFKEPKSRLGSLELRQKKPTDALNYLEDDSLNQSFTNILLTSEAYRQQGHYEKARTVVAQALKEREKDFSSVEAAEALVYLGTLHYEMALALCPYKRAPQRDQHFQRAFQLFTKAFECHEEGQPLATNGMAMVFAQKKEFAVAHKLFSKVLQMNESAHVKMNLGHTYMRGGQTKLQPGQTPNPLDARKALKLYESAWEKNSFVDENEKFHIATSMALAHFVAKDFQKGIEVLERAKLDNPGNQQIIYNLAISKHGRASKVLKNTEERAKPEKVTEAVELLKQAQVGFKSVIESFLHTRSSGSVPLGFEDLQKLEMKKVVGICRGRLTHCEDSIEQCSEWLQRQADSLQQANTKQRREREKQLQMMKEEQEEADVKEKKAKEEEERKRAEAEEIAETLMQDALGMQLPRETDKNPDPVGGKKKPDEPKLDDENAEDMDVEPELDEEGNPIQKAKKGGKDKGKALTEAEKEERRRRKDEKRVARMTEEEREKYLAEKEATRAKRKERLKQKEKKKGGEGGEEEDGEDAAGDEDDEPRGAKRMAPEDSPMAHSPSAHSPAASHSPMAQSPAVNSFQASHSPALGSGLIQSPAAHSPAAQSPMAHSPAPADSPRFQSDAKRMKLEPNTQATQGDASLNDLFDNMDELDSSQRLATQQTQGDMDEELDDLFGEAPAMSDSLLNAPTQPPASQDPNVASQVDADMADLFD